MENNNKYYTPSIEEFHVGFECELRNSSDDNNFEWEHFKIIGVDGGEISGNLMDWSFYDSANAIKDNQVRVKYLDQEDIESLGWFDGAKIEMSCFIFNREDPNNEFQLYYQFDNQYCQIYNWNSQFVFQGVIKNKSELKKLMKQLGIYE